MRIFPLCPTKCLRLDSPGPPLFNLRNLLTGILDTDKIQQHNELSCWSERELLLKSILSMLDFRKSTSESKNRVSNIFLFWHLLYHIERQQRTGSSTPQSFSVAITLLPDARSQAHSSLNSQTVNTKIKTGARSSNFSMNTCHSMLKQTTHSILDQSGIFLSLMFTLKRWLFQIQLEGRFCFTRKATE